MEYSNDFVNRLIEEEITYSNKLSSIYNYPDNITHLLYLIIPAFIIKYGVNYRSLIENCFLSVPVLIDDKQDQTYQAYYFSKPVFKEDKYNLLKGIVLNNYYNIGLMQLLDNLVHEFNHAVNSMQNEFEEGEYLSVRTGIVYNYFDKKSLKFIRKGKENLLEEVINTKQTESIINIIRSFTEYQINNSTVLSTLYSVYHSVDSSYRSNSYFLESIVCKKLLENKTFLSTMETLRINGEVKDIHNFFDTIVGKDGSLLELSGYLEESLLEQEKLANSNSIFKKHRINKIKNINKKAISIVQKFDQNTIYK